MLRAPVIVCLIIAILVSGCASHQQARQPDGGVVQSKNPEWIRYDDWLDNHPVIETAACVLLGTAIGCGVLFLLLYSGPNN